MPPHEGEFLLEDFPVQSVDKLVDWIGRGADGHFARRPISAQPIHICFAEFRAGGLPLVSERL